MNVVKIKQEIVDYIEQADDKTLEAIYTILNPSIQSLNFSISEEEFVEMDNDRKAFLSGKSKGYTWQEARKMITSK